MERKTQSGHWMLANVTGYAAPLSGNKNYVIRLLKQMSNRSNHES